MLFQIEFDTQAIELRIQRKSFLNVFCSSSEIVRIWNCHALNLKILNPRNYVSRILGIKEDWFGAYIYDFLSHTTDPVYKKQFNEILKLTSKDIPHYDGMNLKQKLFDNVVRIVINQGLAIPIKSLWTNVQNFDFHYYCERIFWPTVCLAINHQLDHNAKSKYQGLLVSERSHACFGCGDKKFGSLSAAIKHRYEVHGEQSTYKFEVSTDSKPDSEEDKWIAVQCKKCYTLLMTESSLKNHNGFHEYYDTGSTDLLKDQEHVSLDYSSDSSVESEPELDEGSTQKHSLIHQILEKDELSKISKMNPIQCKLCGKTFRRHNWIDHMKVFHQLKTRNISLDMFKTVDTASEVKSIRRQEVPASNNSEESDLQELSANFRSDKFKERQKRKKQARKAKNHEKPETTKGFKPNKSEVKPYDLTKVLQYLGEEPKSEKSDEQKIRQKNKKLAKKANKENIIIGTSCHQRAARPDTANSKQKH